MVTATNTNKLTKVLDLLNQGLAVKAIAKKCKCTVGYVYNIKSKYLRATEEAAAPDTPKEDKPKVKPVRSTLAERGDKYGKFYDQAGISQALKDVVYASLWQKERRLAPDQMEALDMILHKVARIVNGDPDYADSWHDIAGYAQLVETRLVTGIKI